MRLGNFYSSAQNCPMVRVLAASWVLHYQEKEMTYPLSTGHYINMLMALCCGNWWPVNPPVNAESVPTSIIQQTGMNLHVASFTSKFQSMDKIITST